MSIHKKQKKVNQKNHNHFIHKCKLILYPKVLNSITHLSNVITPRWLNSVFLYSTASLLSKTVVSFELEFLLYQVTLWYLYLDAIQDIAMSSPWTSFCKLYPVDTVYILRQYALDACCLLL